MTTRLEQWGSIRGVRRARWSLGLLVTLAALLGWPATSARAVDDTVVTTADGSKIECSESGQYCLCSGGRESEACKKVFGNCAPGSEPDCEGHWCGCNVAAGSPLYSGAAKIGAGNKLPADARKLVGRIKPKK